MKNNKTPFASPKHRDRRTTLLILGFLLMLGSSINLYAQEFIKNYNDNGLLTPAFPTEKIIEGTGTDTNYYTLTWGANGNSLSSEIGETTVTKTKKDGTILWQNKYWVPPTSMGQKSILWGYTIAADSGTSATGDIAIGGYAVLDSTGAGHTDEDFVMVINTSGTVLWLQHWSPVGGNRNGSQGVKDLIFNHEIGANSGSVTAVSLDYNSTSSVENMFVTLVKSTGIIAMEELTDGTGNYNQILATNVNRIPKPRIVESPTNSMYYVAGCRHNTSNAGDEIGFWKVPYGLAVLPEFDEYYISTNSQLFITGAVEDEGHYSIGGNPTVYLSGFYGTSSPVPLLVEVSSLSSSPPTFKALKIPLPTTFTGILYPTDIATVRVKQGSVYQLMTCVNHRFLSNLGVPIHEIYAFRVPMNFSGTPTCAFVHLYDGSDPFENEFGGMIQSTKDVHAYMFAGDDLGAAFITLSRTNDKLEMCPDTSTTTTTNPSYSTMNSLQGNSKTVSSSSATPGDTAYTSDTVSICYHNSIGPSAPEQQNFGSEFEQQPVGETISIGMGSHFLSIYPNPVTSLVNIDIKAQGKTTVQICVFDMTGRAIINQNAEISPGTNHAAVDMTSVKAGLYIITVTNPEKSINISTRIEKY